MSKKLDNYANEVISQNYLLIHSFDALEVSTLEGRLYCSILVGLKETNKNQNHLMNKKFRGLIKVNTLFK